MARSAAVYFRKGIAPKTERQYEGVWRRYEDLCRRMGEDPLPVTENKAIAHVVTVADEGVQASTVNHHLAGLRQGQIRAGLPAPSWAAMARLGQVRRGVARRAAEKGQAGLVRDPVTPAHMEVLRKTWGRQGDRGVVLWAAACACYFGCLRAGEALAPDDGKFDEAAHLTFKDVTVDVLEKPQIVTLRIKESKTDRLRKGAKVTLGRTGQEICPVKALLRYLVQRKGGVGPFFRLGEGKPLTRRAFVREVKIALETAGMPSGAISGHSFRIGAATAAAKGGATESQIKDMRRWKSREYRGYVRLGSGRQAAMAVTLAKDGGLKQQ